MGVKITFRNLKEKQERFDAYKTLIEKGTPRKAELAKKLAAFNKAEKELTELADELGLPVEAMGLEYVPDSFYMPDGYRDFPNWNAEETLFDELEGLDEDLIEELSNEFAQYIGTGCLIGHRGNWNSSSDRC